MLRLMKKFSLMFIFYAVLIFGIVTPLFNYDRMTGPDPLSLSFVFYLAPYMFLVAIGSLWAHELMEEKTKSYEFLRLLPIKECEIVGAKFALVFLSVAFYAFFLCIFLFLVSKDPDYLNPGRAFIIINGDIFLVLAALLYLGIFKFGYSKFGKIVLLVWIIGLISPIPINIFLLKRLGITKVQIIDWITNINWIAFTVISLSLYWGLMQIAIKIRKAKH